MARDVTLDGITDTLIIRYVTVLSPLAGWGTLAGTTNRAVYPHLGLPMPSEPFPAGYVYLAGVSHAPLGTGQRMDTYRINIRILGGPVTPTYKVQPESAVYQMVTAVTSELLYRPFLQDPTAGQNNAPFRYLDTKNPVTVGDLGRIQAFSYGADQGAFVGIEIPTTVGLTIHVGRLS